jgi:hypothetical protein
MKTMLFCAASIFAGILLTTPAQAVTVNYSVDGVAAQQFASPTTAPAGAPHILDGWGYAGDTVTLGSASGSFDLVNGASYTLKVNDLLWGVAYTYGGTATDFSQSAWSDLSFVVNAVRNIHIDTATASLSQTGLLKSTWDDDFLSFSAGPMVSLMVQGFQVDVTVNGLPIANVDNFNGNVAPPTGGFAQTPRDITATFVVSAAPASVPDGGTTLALMAVSLAGISALRRKFAR